MADVTIVIPTRNRVRFLPRAIGTVLQQAGVDIELIVVDDGSDDQTWQLLSSLTDPRVRTIRHGQRLGVAAARNSGIEAATAPWLAFLDDDDLWSPVKLRNQLRRLRDSGAGFCYSSVVVVDESLEALNVVVAHPAATVAQSLRRGNVIYAGASNIVTRTSALHNLGGFDETLHQIADWDMWLRLADTLEPAALSETLLAYVRHPDNMISTEKGDVLAEFSRMAQKYAHGRDPSGLSLHSYSFMAWAGEGYRMAGHRRAAARVFLSALVRHPTPFLVSRLAATLAGPRMTKAGMRLLRRHHDRMRPTAPDWLQAYREA